MNSWALLTIIGPKTLLLAKLGLANLNYYQPPKAKQENMTYDGWPIFKNVRFLKH